jgi:hypothetical protein
MMTIKFTEGMEQKGEKRNTYEVLVGKLEGKRPLGRPGHRWMWAEYFWLRKETNGGLL